MRRGVAGGGGGAEEAGGSVVGGEEEGCCVGVGGSAVGGMGAGTGWVGRLLVGRSSLGSWGGGPRSVFVAAGVFLGKGLHENWGMGWGSGSRDVLLAETCAKQREGDSVGMYFSRYEYQNQATGKMK